MLSPQAVAWTGRPTPSPTLHRAGRVKFFKTGPKPVGHRAGPGRAVVPKPNFTKIWRALSFRALSCLFEKNAPWPTTSCSCRTVLTFFMPVLGRPFSCVYVYFYCTFDPFTISSDAKQISDVIWSTFSHPIPTPWSRKPRTVELLVQLICQTLLVELYIVCAMLLIMVLCRTGK